ncbi:MAG: glycoside hydrolase family 105 protein [Lachnospirales bacterium]
MDKVLVFLNELIENSTYNKPLWNVEKIVNNGEANWNYIDGCMLKAIMEVYYVTEDEKYLDFVRNFIDYYVDDEGNIVGYKEEDYNCDHINEGKVLFMLNAIHKRDKYKKAINKLYSQLKNQPRTKSGNFCHKLIYPNQIWLDGLYMVQPFYMEYEMLFNKKENYKDIFNQFKRAYYLMKDEKTGLLYHGYDESRQQPWANKETGLSKNFWTRSIGWFVMALVDTIEKLDEMFFYEREELIKYLKEISDALFKVMSENYLFYQVTNMGGKKGNYLETSGSCAISYGFMKGARLGYLPSFYFETGERIYNSVLNEKLDMETGFNLKDICLVAGLGGMAGKGNYKKRDGTYEYYISEPVVNNDGKGVAPFLFAYSEIIRKQRGK